MAKARIEKPIEYAHCQNPECGTQFKKNRRWQKHCSKKCRNRHVFLRSLAKKRTEAVTCCPNCGTEYAVRIVPA